MPQRLANLYSEPDKQPSLSLAPGNRVQSAVRYNISKSENLTMHTLSLTLSLAPITHRLQSEDFRHPRVCQSLKRADRARLRGGLSADAHVQHSPQLRQGLGRRVYAPDGDESALLDRHSAQRTAAMARQGPHRDGSAAAALHVKLVITHTHTSVRSHNRNLYLRRRRLSAFPSRTPVPDFASLAIGVTSLTSMCRQAPFVRWYSGGPWHSAWFYARKTDRRRRERAASEPR